uniref:Uncharacterized protein n=1 Tax=Knipowitschia caucasica TaxID=637954 RepID=A0AAV2ML74_KNICA
MSYALGKWPSPRGAGGGDPRPGGTRVTRSTGELRQAYRGTAQPPDRPDCDSARMVIESGGGSKVTSSCGAQLRSVQWYRGEPGGVRPGGHTGLVAALAKFTPSRGGVGFTVRVLRTDGRGGGERGKVNVKGVNRSGRGSTGGGNRSKRTVKGAETGGGAGPGERGARREAERLSASGWWGGFKGRAAAGGSRGGGGGSDPSPARGCPAVRRRWGVTPGIGVRAGGGWGCPCGQIPRTGSPNPQDLLRL